MSKFHKKALTKTTLQLNVHIQQTREDTSLLQRLNMLLESLYQHKLFFFACYICTSTDLNHAVISFNWMFQKLFVLHLKARSAREADISATFP